MKNAALYVRTANAETEEIINQTGRLVSYVKNIGYGSRKTVCRS